MQKFLIVKVIILCFISFIFGQNNEMVGKNKTPKIWKKWSKKERHNSKPFNPYLDKKKDDLPSSKISRQNKKEMRKQKRMAKKLMKKNKKNYGH